MNETFRAELIARLTELTDGLQFDHKPSDSKKKIEIIDTMLGAKEKGYKDGDEFPFLRVAIRSGSFRPRRPSPFSVYLLAGIYTAGTISDGTNDITALTLALGRIVDKRSFPPWRLTDEVPFLLGSPEQGMEGIQPHPYYYLTMNLEFIVP